MTCKNLLRMFFLFVALSTGRDSAGAVPDGPGPLVFRVRLEGSAGAELPRESVRCSSFPGGAHSALTYHGASKPETVAFMGHLGFRTTVYLPPDAEKTEVRALEAAGAEIAVLQAGASKYWGEHYTIQEMYDLVVTARGLLGAKCNGPILCSSTIASGQRSPEGVLRKMLSRTTTRGRS